MGIPFKDLTVCKSCGGFSHPDLKGVGNARSAMAAITDHTESVTTKYHTILAKCWWAMEPIKSKSLDPIRKELSDTLCSCEQHPHTTECLLGNKGKVQQQDRHADKMLGKEGLEKPYAVHNALTPLLTPEDTH